MFFTPSFSSKTHIINLRKNIRSIYTKFWHHKINILRSKPFTSFTFTVLIYNRYFGISNKNSGF